VGNWLNQNLIQIFETETMSVAVKCRSLDLTLNAVNAMVKNEWVLLLK
jgi:hypothetical protein